MPLTDWQDYAACHGRDPDLFFKKPEGIAKAICAACPVFEQCRSWTDRCEESIGEHGCAGIYAGENPRERTIRRARALEAVA